MGKVDFRNKKQIVEIEYYIIKIFKFKIKNYYLKLKLFYLRFKLASTMFWRILTIKDFLNIYCEKYLESKKTEPYYEMLLNMDKKKEVHF